MKINEIITESVKQRLDPKCWKNKHKAGTKIKGGVRVNNCKPNEGVAEGLYLDEGITDFILKAKDKFLRLKDALSDEWAQSKQMWQIVKKGNKSTSREINFANNQFKDILRMVGLTVWYALPIPGNTLLILATEKLLNQIGMSIMPDKIKNQVLNVKEQGVAEDWNKVNHHDKTDGLSQKAVNAYRRENPGSKLKTAVTTKPSKLKAGSKDAKRRKSFCARMSGNKGPMKDEHGKPTPKAKVLRRWNC